MRRRTLHAGTATLPATTLFRLRRAQPAEISDGLVKIGVLDNMFADQQGYGRLRCRPRRILAARIWAHRAKWSRPLQN